MYDAIFPAAFLVPGTMHLVWPVHSHSTPQRLPKLDIERSNRRVLIPCDLKSISLISRQQLEVTPQGPRRSIRTTSLATHTMLISAGLFGLLVPLVAATIDGQVHQLHARQAIPSPPSGSNSTANLTITPVQTVLSGDGANVTVQGRFTIVRWS